MLRKISYQPFVALALLILAVIACGGGGNNDSDAAATNTPAPTATPDITANFTSFTSETLGLSLRYPADWAIDDSFVLTVASSNELLSSTEGVTDGAILVFVSSPRADFAGTDPKAILSDSFSQMAAGDGFVMQGEPAAQTINGQDGAVVNLTGTAENGIALTGFMAFVSQGDWATLVLGMSPTDVADNYLPTLTAILNSVQVNEPVATEVPAVVEVPTAEPTAAPTVEPTAVPTVAPTAAPTEEPAAAEPINQWATSAIASSEFSSSWAATNAIGPADTPDCGDYTTAWASGTSSGVDWIEVYYDVPVHATQVNIYESYNPDQVSLVELIDVDGNVVEAYSQTSETYDVCPMMLSIDLGETDFLVHGVRITVDQSVLGLGWNEIDAVELVGIPAN